LQIKWQIYALLYDGDVTFFPDCCSHTPNVLVGAVDGFFCNPREDCNIHNNMKMDFRIGQRDTTIDWFYSNVKEEAGMSGTRLENTPGYHISLNNSLT